MLNQIQALLATNQVMTEQALVNQLKVSVDALAPMLTLLYKRGKIEPITGGDCTGGCGCVNAKISAWQLCAPDNKPLGISVISRQ
ncbi:hypothetical protein FE810_12385 [Thalassotalea litorea]|uniref:Transcriptional regulator HTH-type FeoC domain-containing protein n=1 Tax=Thalassotalea litorea TaxID=2020715 RepID=A0A5R9II21_9GAMM|nr:FeoC-like transcriptional regulator [Thalassotalea litorea]TLU64103.1 hypothetical protein FE810_12385 [Thalassotalea litorea]